MRTFATAMAATVVGLGMMWGCGGYGSSANNGGNPGSPSPASTAVTIDVVAIRGSQSFSPNPATVPTGQMVVWRNVDTVTHRVVLDDRSVDSGMLSPGGSSVPMTIGTVGSYHCTIHPEMVGSLTR
jgi:plastocyanin